VRLWVDIPDGSEADVRSLYDWLAAEPEIRTAAHLIRQTETPPPGEMGEVLSAISLIVGSGLSLGQLLVAIAAWRATRPRPYRVSVRFPDRTVAIEASDADEALAIARRLESD